eukprot:gnl/TRDRNA2_/TRDRNA2_202434_c0_seq1.p1 gnl/TRDRNA2_/TRDRNA2_202434_c0~~gnl/TRDRNA2_/TRDRNA2_202434_c0_seq1.p1  ORF type:complete len:373 (-),score=80.09 gnl/TRDRNA2_/TRDRNA2_202434_c0_seq1:118-1236(-)
MLLQEAAPRNPQCPGTGPLVLSLLAGFGLAIVLSIGGRMEQPSEIQEAFIARSWHRLPATRAAAPLQPVRRWQLRPIMVAASNDAAPEMGRQSITALPPEIVEAGGVPVAKDATLQEGLGNMLAAQFVGVNLTFPGVHVLNIDPPVLKVEGFLTAADCDKFVAAAKASNMQKSRVGGGGANSLRTSSTLALTQDVLGRSPELRAQLDGLLAQAEKLLRLDAVEVPSTAHGSFRPPSAEGRFAYELPQVASYAPGEHFKKHEDAFPIEIAQNKHYQRRATLLVYLNDVQQGGRTAFNLFSLSVPPRKGDALIFFPAFANGHPDHRTLHEAQDAMDDKWVIQLWVSCGLQGAGAGTGNIGKVRTKKAKATTGFR